MPKKFWQVLVLFGTFLWLLVLAPPAHAYIDPASGSFAFQAIIAALVGAVFSVKMFWRRLRAFFTRRTGSSTTQP